MTSTTSRSVLICGMWATALLVSGRAQGQTGGLAATDFTVLFKGYFNGQWVQMNSTQQQYYFNQARCLCDTDPNGEFEVMVEPSSSAGQKILTQLESNLTGGQGASYLFAGASGYDCLTATTTSYRITGLQNGISHGVGVAAVDKYGNIGASSDIAYAMPGAGMGGIGGTSGAGGYVGDPDADATGGALGSGGAAGGSPPDGAAGSADAGTQVRLGNGCSCDIRGKHGRNETAGTLWLALVSLAFALRSLRSSQSVAGRRRATD